MAALVAEHGPAAAGLAVNEDEQDIVALLLAGRSA